MTHETNSWPCGHNNHCFKLWRRQWTLGGAPQLCPPITLLNSTVPTGEFFGSLGSTISQDLMWVSNIDKIIKKFPAEDVLYAPAQAVQPPWGAFDPILLCSNPACCLHIHHCMVWISHQTGQGQTTTDGELWRRNHWCWLAPFRICTNPESGNRQATSLQTHHTLNTGLFQLLPSGRCYTVHRPERCIYAFDPF